MPKAHAQLRAKLKWEAACERLRNSLQTPRGAPCVGTAERLAAYRLALEALKEIREVFDIEPQPSPDCLAEPEPHGQPLDGLAAPVAPS
jgi:hypothetical protein